MKILLLALIFVILVFCGLQYVEALFLVAFIFLLFYAYKVRRKEKFYERAFASFSAMLRTTPNYMAITDSSCQVRYLSEAMVNFMQCPSKEFAVGQPFIDLVADRGLKMMFADILDSDGYYETIVPLDIGGEEKYFKVISDKLHDEAGGLFIDISDITQMVKSQIAAEDAQRMAEQANIAKSKFLATMSHEIRTPMNAIIGVTEIEMNKKKHSKETLDSLRKIYNSGYILLHIINDILDLSKIEAGKFEISSVKYDVASLINDTVQLNIMRMGSKEIDFLLEVPEDLPAYLIGDELRIKQILNNLLSNAFKYTRKGQVALGFKSEPDGENIRLAITVRDTGQGMSEEQVEKLFCEYSRFNLETNRAVEGTGLGLSITKKLVELMQGNIAVESKLGAGSVFTVQLLQRPTESSPIGKEVVENLKKFHFFGEKQTEKAQIVREYMPYGSVLVVDDIETNLFVAKGLLQPYGLKVETATSGFETLEKIRKGKVYDIVFMDHMMPKMDGIETAKRMREMGYAQPIVALTANAISGQAELFIQNGFDGFISKPIDIRQMNEVLNKMIRNKQNNALRSVFAVDVKRVLPVLENVSKNIAAATDEDLRLFAISAHAMKSALANIGEREISKQAALLEVAGKELDKNIIQAETQSFIEGLKAIVDVEASGAEAGNYAAKDENPAYLREQLQEISEACKNIDEQTAGIAIASLRKKQWTKETKAFLDQIAELLLFSDFDEIESRIFKFLNSP